MGSGTGGGAGKPPLPLLAMETPLALPRGASKKTLDAEEAAMGGVAELDVPIDAAAAFSIVSFAKDAAAASRLAPEEGEEEEEDFLEDDRDKLAATPPPDLRPPPLPRLLLLESGREPLFSA